MRVKASRVGCLLCGRIPSSLSGKVPSAMLPSHRAAALVLCALALGACRKSQAPKTGEHAGRGPVIDSHTLIAPIDESIDTALALFKRVGVVELCNKNG